jgi:superfamily II DNA/RNA helicase
MVSFFFQKSRNLSFSSFSSYTQINFTPSKPYPLMTSPSFYDIGLTDATASRVKELGYENPTPIQQKVIPPILMQRDILACAETGTGKSAAFLLPMIDILAHARRLRIRMPRALIVETTRELALQLEENFIAYAEHLELTSALLIGGVGASKQEQKLDRGIDVLIATPGRLLDHIANGKIMLNDVSMFVVDEADRMLDMGFIPDMRQIFSFLPKNRQTLLFSATMPPDIQQLADDFMINPKKIFVTPQSSISANIQQELVHVSSFSEKISTLVQLLNPEHVTRALIFCNRKRDVDKIGKELQNRKIPAGILHGDMSQHIRLECMQKFRDGLIRFLVCSDVVARGIDVSDISHIFNIDVPEHPEDYVHRIGRTGRAGKNGHAFTFALPDDKLLIEKIQELPGAKLNTAPPSAHNLPANKKHTLPHKKNSQKKHTRDDNNAPPFIKKVDNHKGAFGKSDQVPDFLKKTPPS